METVYDWVTVAIFAGLVVLFMQRSSSPDPSDSLWQYLIASVGCATANWLGNRALKLGDATSHLLAIAVLMGTLFFIYRVLKPFDNFKK